MTGLPVYRTQQEIQDAVNMSLHAVKQEAEDEQHVSLHSGHA